MAEIKHATDTTFEQIVINNDKPVDVDANPGLSQAFGIMSIPMIAFFAPGQQAKGAPGYRSAEQLEQLFGLQALVAPAG